MAVKKTLIRSLAVLSLVAGAGAYTMQTGATPSAPPASLSGIGISIPPLGAMAVPGNANVMLPDQALVLPVVETGAPPPAQAIPDPTDVVADNLARSALGLPCEVTVSATAMPGALVALDVMAPCEPETEVVIAHSGLTLSGQTDAFGLLTLDIPAFETPAYFSVEFPDGRAEHALIPVPDLPDFDRVALHWQGDTPFALHAMEFGAAFGEPGHVWQDAPGTQDALLRAEGGVLTILGNETGDTARHAQVYTVPRASFRQGDTVRLSIDAPITASNCTSQINADLLRVTAGSRVDVTPIELTMPGCDAVGDYLLLQNLLGDLRLSSN